MNNLASVLEKNGLAASASQAMKMAENILGTEKRVSKNFDAKNKIIDDGLSKNKKTYQEEIDDLIEKTSPEKKDFHYMVSGYKEADKKKPEGKLGPNMKDIDAIAKEIEPKVEEKPVEVKEAEDIVEEIAKPEIREEIEVKEEIEPEIEVYEEPAEPEKEIIINENMEEEVVEPEPVFEEAIPEQVIEEKPTIDEPVFEVRDEPVHENKAITEAIEAAKPVHTDSVFDDDRMLKDMMDEQAEEVYSNKPAKIAAPEPVAPEPTIQEPMVEEEEDMPETPEYNIVGFQEPEPSPEPEPISPEPLSNAPLPEEKEEFIVPVQEPSLPQAEPELEPELEEQEAAPQEEEKKEFKNPIDEVNLLDHFKFG